jgi:hypothetical protein
MRRRWMAAVLLAAGCAPARPAPEAWVPLAEWRGAAISYDPRTVERQPDGAWITTLALDYTVPQTFQETTYTRHEMRVHVHCGRQLVGSTDFWLYADGRRVRTGTLAAEWYPVRPEGSAESAWVPALCRMLEPGTAG